MELERGDERTVPPFRYYVRPKGEANLKAPFRERPKGA